MNVIIVSIVVFIFRVSAIEVLKQRRGDFETTNRPQWIPGQVSGNLETGVGNQMNSTVFMSVNHYYCAAEEVEDQILILYGTKSWTFPIQDVNLTLSYPTDNSRSEWTTSDDGYLVTGFKVVLYVDGMETKGYIVDGGVMQESLNLSFVSLSVRSLSYEFWLYGAPKHDLSELYKTNNTRYFICT